MERSCFLRLPLFILILALSVLMFSSLRVYAQQPLAESENNNVTAIVVKAYKSLPKTPDPLARCVYCHKVAEVSRDDCLTCHIPQHVGCLNATMVHKIHSSMIMPSILYPFMGSYCDICHKPGMVGTLEELGHPDTKYAEKVGKELRKCESCHYIGSGDQSCRACHREGMPHIPGWGNCTVCHGGLPSPQRITVAPHISSLKGSKHENLTIIYGRKNEKVCYMCHDFESGFRLLVMAVDGGKKIPYNQLDRMCGQVGCHSDYYYLWAIGKHHSPALEVRGHCTNRECHNPHYPYIPPPGTHEEFVKELGLQLNPTTMVIVVLMLGIVYFSIFVYHKIKRG